MEAVQTLRLLDPDGEVGPGEPQSYAEALLELHNARAKADRLVEENGHLGEALKRSQIYLQKLKSQQHKDLRLHKDYASVERLWGKYRQAHPRCGEQVPEDYLKLALDRLKDFDEYALSRALDGAARNPPVNRETKVVYDRWDNVFRNTGNVHSYLERADLAEGRAHRERDLGVARVLRELHLVSLDELAARCACGHLAVDHLSCFDGDAEGRSRCCYAGCGCLDLDDQDWRAEQWVARQERRR